MFLISHHGLAPGAGNAARNDLLEHPGAGLGYGGFFPLDASEPTWHRGCGQMDVMDCVSSLTEIEDEIREEEFEGEAFSACSK